MKKRRQKQKIIVSPSQPPPKKIFMSIAEICKEAKKEGISYGAFVLKYKL